MSLVETCRDILITILVMHLLKAAHLNAIQTFCVILMYIFLIFT